jgi:Domain of unknown function (DUF4412)
MKRALPLLLLLAAWSHADLVIEQKMESAFVNGNVLMKIKGDNARVDMPGPAGDMSVLVDMKKGEIATLVHAQKVAMKMNVEAAKKAGEQEAKKAGIDPAKIEQPKSTGQKEKVGEWEAEIYETKLGNSPARFWVAKDVPNYKSIMDQINKLSTATGSAGFDISKFDMGGMVVKSEMNTPAGKVTATVVKVSEDSVDPSIFQVPAGYQETKVPGQ